MGFFNNGGVLTKRRYRLQMEEWKSGGRVAHRVIESSTRPLG